MNAPPKPPSRIASKVISFQSDFGDAPGRNRSEIALTRIANAFPDRDDCWCSETFRAWLDGNQTTAESESGWINCSWCAHIELPRADLRS
jgi:hypothetical protein